MARKMKVYGICIADSQIIRLSRIDVSQSSTSVYDMSGKRYNSIYFDFFVDEFSNQLNIYKIFSPYHAEGLAMHNIDVD